MTEAATLSVLQIGAVKALIDTLAELEISPLHLHIDAKSVGDQRPDVRLWTQTRTDFERLCARLKIKAKEARWSPQDQRQWSAEHDTADRRLLIQCVSFKHHADWVAKPRGAA